MASVADFRGFAFSITKVEASGRDIGRRSYWKLYAFENLLRVVVHSVLSAEVAPNWWASSVGQKLQAKVTDRKALYAAKPWHSTPGKHDIYYTFLSDLNTIITAHRHLFALHVPDIDQWIARLELIRLPRNVVGHMNWPHAADRKHIDDFYDDLQRVVRTLGRSGSGITLMIP